MELEMEKMDRAGQLQALRVLKDSLGWKIFQDHLVKQWSRREQARSEYLRLDNMHAAKRTQFEADGINLVMNELDKLIAGLNSSKTETEEKFYA